MLITDDAVTYVISSTGISSGSVPDITINGQSCKNDLLGTIKVNGVIDGLLSANQQNTIICTATNAFSGKTSSELSIQYSTKQSPIQHTITGQGSGKVEKGSAPSLPEYNDGTDNDADTFTDYPEDPGCTSASDTSELGTVQCDDGTDNDADTSIDYPDDTDCTDATDNDESTPPIIQTINMDEACQSATYPLPSGVIYYTA